jgi:Amt family ammonium transporter
MVFFQFVFAAITVVILGGAVLARMNFHAWMIFVPLWLTFSYSIGKLQQSFSPFRIYF